MFVYLPSPENTNKRKNYLKMDENQKKNEERLFTFFYF